MGSHKCNSIDYEREKKKKKREEKVFPKLNDKVHQFPQISSKKGIKKKKKNEKHP
jgi:hypothetical protein